MTSRKTNNNSHHQYPRSAPGMVLSCAPSSARHKENVCANTPQFHGCAVSMCQRGTMRARRANLLRIRSTSASPVIVEYGGTACVLCMAVPMQEPQELTGNFCGMRFPSQKTNEFSEKMRTEMSVPSAGSAAIASISATSRRWPSQSRQKRTWRFLRASTLGLRAAGSPMTASRQPTYSASCSPRS